MQNLKTKLRKSLFFGGIVGLMGITGCFNEGRFDKYKCSNIPILTKDHQGNTIAESVTFIRSDLPWVFNQNRYIMEAKMSDGRTITMVNTRADTSLDRATVFFPDGYSAVFNPNVAQSAEAIMQLEKEIFKPNFKKILEYKNKK